ncbi:MAG: hypothetical protein IPK62_09120 [Bacteroidetes bacterium]|nr:hypothetical protein [Bacteroidota bacterium]
MNTVLIGNMWALLMNMTKQKINILGAISAISVNPMDPMEIFVGANSAGLFHTSNRGLSWNASPTSIGILLLG